jgi:hypothetical protein
MTIQFLQDHVTADGRPYLKGEVVTVSTGVAERLIEAGIARKQTRPEPQEKKRQ